MPLKKMKIEELPKRKCTGGGRRLLQKTQEWQDFLAVLANGLKPYEAVRIDPPNDHKGYKSPKSFAVAFNRAAKKHVKNLKLSYDVYMADCGVNIVGRY